MSIKPILFNTDMVRAILDGRKTVTRRVVNYKHLRGLENLTAEKIQRACVAPYQIGDVLYVRETWAKQQGLYWHKAGLPLDENGRAYGVVPPDKWCPSIHMPREAARIWLRVTDVRVERLQEIDEDGAIAEGLYKGWRLTQTSSLAETARQAFIWLWQHLTRKGPAGQGWAADPWVWVIKFERCEKPEGGA